MTLGRSHTDHTNTSKKVDWLTNAKWPQCAPKSQNRKGRADYPDSGLAAYHLRMSDEQKRFDDLMKRVIKVSPEELRKRLKAQKTANRTAKPKIAKRKETNNEREGTSF